MTYFLCLGSNVGSGTQNLARARRLLEKAGLKIVRASSVYRSEPVDVRDQPWFTNQVLEVSSGLSPSGLLQQAKGIESKMGRTPGPPKGPRTIDIDILFAGSSVIETPELTIPHPALARRKFVLVPLSEIAPGFVHPVFGRTVRDLAAECPDASSVVRTARGGGPGGAPGRRSPAGHRGRARRKPRPVG